MTDDAAGDPAEAVVLDFLPNGKPDDDRPQYQRQPVAYVLGVADFRLFEVAFEEDARVVIGSRVAIEGEPDERILRARSAEFDDLPGGARSELEYAVEDIVEADESRFVKFYNDAQAITTRLHALNLLPGIGKKLRNNILDERKRGQFESFEDLEDRVSGLHDPKGVLVERILEEIREAEMKYRIFARRDQE